MSRSRVALTALAVVRVGATRAGGAAADSVARCHFEAHVTFTSAYPQSGSASCVGMLHDRVTSAQGTFTIQSAPAFSASSDTGDITFTTTLKRMLDFSIQGQSDVFDGHLHLGRVGSMLTVSGNGSMYGQGLSYSGTGQFTRDSGSPQAGAEFGQLTLDVTISNGQARPNRPIPRGATSRSCGESRSRQPARRSHGPTAR